MLQVMESSMGNATTLTTPQDQVYFTLFYWKKFVFNRVQQGNSKCLVLYALTPGGLLPIIGERGFSSYF